MHASVAFHMFATIAAKALSLFGSASAPAHANIAPSNVSSIEVVTPSALSSLSRALTSRACSILPDDACVWRSEELTSARKKHAIGIRIIEYGIPQSSRVA